MASSRSAKAARNGSGAVVEYGDFQTPLDLAQRVCGLLESKGIRPVTVIEPSCGTGSFLEAAARGFPTVRRLLGIEINADYLEAARARLQPANGCHLELRCESFFNVDWKQVAAGCPEPVLFLGNPPWVTNATLGSLASSNLPFKRNLRGDKGLDAITGKGNFDISEWLIIALLRVIRDRPAVVAMLCKTAVARKALSFAWENGFGLSNASMYLIDAAAEFSVSTDACLLVCSGAATVERRCAVHESLEADGVGRMFGMAGSELVADFRAYESTKHLRGKCAYQWRSGIKHDCSQVIELRQTACGLINGLGEPVDLEEDNLFPMLKGSQLSKGNPSPDRRMLVTQLAVGHDTARLRETAPRTWAYLQRHVELLDRRGSSIYKGRPRFSIFGIGPYTFAPWKVAIAALYKQLSFQVVGPHEGKPVVFDDTCYFVPCRTEDEARSVARILNSALCREFYSAYIFWDNKRPVTVEILARLDLGKAARELGEHIDGGPAPIDAESVEAEGMLF